MKKLLTVLAAVSLVALGGTAFAKPGGKDGGLKDDPEVGKQLWKFNVIFKTNGNWDDNGNACNGSRIFFSYAAGGGNNSTIVWYLDRSATKDFEITDCNGTDGAAAVTVDEEQNFLVAIRVLGKKNSNVKFDCTTLNAIGVDTDDIKSAGEQLCPIGGVVNLNKSKDFTKVMKNIADEPYEEVLWTFDESKTWKIFDVRLFEYNPPVGP